MFRVYKGLKGSLHILNSLELGISRKLGCCPKDSCTVYSMALHGLVMDVRCRYMDKPSGTVHCRKAPQTPQAASPGKLHNTREPSGIYSTIQLWPNE